MSRADLLALTPESVAALSNLGLVKRAQREIAAGQGPALEEDETSGVVSGRFPDGVATELPRGVPLRDGRCSCGAQGVCRHRVAVVLAYPAWHAQRAAGDGATPEAVPAPGESAPVIVAAAPPSFDDAALSKLVGKRLFARATAIVSTGVIVELAGGAVPTAKLPTCAVRFHVPDDLAYARCDCQAAIACEHLVVAVWAFRRAGEAGTALPCTIELGAKGAVTSGSDAPIDEALRLADYVLTEGVVHMTEADKPRFARARAALSASSDLLWLATIVDDLEIALEAYRARSARYRASEVLHLLASLAARARAARNGGELPPRYVLGSDEARETRLDHVRLVALGARVFSDGDDREAEVYLADPDSGTVLVSARRFPSGEGKEAEDGPALARRVLTGRITLGTLAHGQLVTRAAKRQANRAVTLATTRTAQTSVAPSSGEWGSLPPDLLIRDFAPLAEALRTQPPRVLRPRLLAAGIRVLAVAPGGVHHVGYRGGDQELVALLGDGSGGRVTLLRRYERAAPRALDVLARALDAAQGPRFIAGEVRLGPSGVEIEPTAIVTDRVLVPDLDSDSAQLTALPALPPAPARPIQTALDLAQATLEEGLHDGLAYLRSGFADRVRGAEVALGGVGLADLERRVGALRAGTTREPRTWLDAALRLELTREVALSG